MKIKNIIVTILMWFIIFGLPFYFSFNECFEREKPVESDSVSKNDKSHSYVMYKNLEKYSKEFKIPKHIVYNIAFLETSYRGPKDMKYKPNRTSSAGAVGPMQVMPKTANGIHKKKVSVKKLKNDIEFNIITSLTLLKQLYKKYGDWSLVCGYYNTGYPKVNKYALFCVNQKNYKKNWVSYQ